jgi:hypothetical protein
MGLEKIEMGMTKILRKQQEVAIVLKKDDCVISKG